MPQPQRGTPAARSAPTGPSAWRWRVVWSGRSCPVRQGDRRPPERLARPGSAGVVVQPGHRHRAARPTRLQTKARRRKKWCSTMHWAATTLRISIRRNWWPGRAGGRRSSMQAKSAPPASLSQREPRVCLWMWQAHTSCLRVLPATKAGARRHGVLRGEHRRGVRLSQTRGLRQRLGKMRLQRCKCHAPVLARVRRRVACHRFRPLQNPAT